MIKFNRLVVVFAPNSTRAEEYFRKVRPELIKIASQQQATFREIALDNLPYFAARDLIEQQLTSDDLLVAAGGDGAAQVSFDAAFRSSDVTFAVLPLGNGNDLSQALNGRMTNPVRILNGSRHDFYPLDVRINGEKAIALSSYLTLGATVILTDFLNQEVARGRRKKLKFLSPAAGLPLKNLREVSRQINELDSPAFTRDGLAYDDDSLGFFLINAARGILRPNKNITFSDEEFFFHISNQKFGSSLLQKILRAGLWATKFPGQVSESEEITFDQPIDLVVNLAGDTVELKDVQKISAERSRTALKVLAK
ncbi:hypothetical protein FWG95_00530 [Candidatus Saccharibacteria bacterium]|nr:hypothetical protein [Candidatus Saccharibacteria bacterium]